MARKRNPLRDKAFRLYADSGGKIKLKEIAEKLSVPASRIRKWKSEDSWVSESERSDSKQKERSDSEPTKLREKRKIKKKLFDAVDGNDELTENQRLFCVFYADTNNATQAYIKSHKCKKTTAMVEGFRTLRNPKIQTEVKRLKKIMRAEFDVEAADLIRYCLKITGADIGDSVQFGRREVPVMGMYGPVIDKKTKKPLTETVNYIDIAESENVDTSVVTEIKQGRDGIGIKLADKKWAWEKLEAYFGWQDKADDDDDLQIIDDIRDEEDEQSEGEDK